jgi:hypothetical protein
MLAQQDFGLQKGNDFVPYFLRFEHAAVTAFATGLLTAAHTQHIGTIGSHLRQVALRGRVLPHLPVHRRGQ